MKTINNRCDLLILTNLPAFYKVNLFNKLAEKGKIRVVFFQRNTKQRANEFYGDPDEMNFECIYLSDYNFIYRYFLLIRMLLKGSYSRMIAGGWDSFYYWLALVLSDKTKNALINESSCQESRIDGVKGLVKRLLVKRVSIAYLPGQSHACLMEHLQFHGLKIITKGVGLFHYNSRIKRLITEECDVSRFLYVGRFAKEKNLEFLIRTFNDLPHLKLTLIGYGPLEAELKEIARSNIQFEGRVDNKDMAKYYHSHDVFVLPSLSEPWGLVVEEALHHGLPVLLSSKVGCADTLMEADKYGCIFNPQDSSDLTRCINGIRDKNTYDKMVNAISELDFEEVGRKQVEAYLITSES